MKVLSILVNENEKIDDSSLEVFSFVDNLPDIAIGNITFDDWIFKQDERVAINKATMTKFGFKVAELTVVFVKD